MTTPAPSRTRALLETLRAPLLLSPTADVLAGAAIAVAWVAPAATTAETETRGVGILVCLGGLTWSELALPLLLAACCGTALLAAGMAQNALADLDDDRARKPERPLPRGAISEGSVRTVQRALIVFALVCAGLLSTRVLAAAAAILLGSWLYHHQLKQFRVPGCITLGCLRGLDLSLGLFAVAAVVAAGGPSSELIVGAEVTRPSLSLQGIALWIPAALYAAYIAGASLHASTDDEPARSVWSPVGLGLCSALLLGLALLGVAGGSSPRGGVDPTTQRALAAAGAVVFVYALGRLISAWRTKPPPAITGAALSGLYLFDAGLCLVFGSAAIPAAIALLLFGASRRMLRTFPPS